MNAPRVIAEVKADQGWKGLIEGFRLALDDLKITYEVASELGCLPDRYVEKLLSPNPTKSFGPMSFGALMWVSGIKILIVPDDQVREILVRNPKFSERKAGPNRHNASHRMRAMKRRRKRPHLTSEFGKIGRAHQLLTTTPAQRKSAARKAAKARWRKPRLVEVKGEKAKKLRAELSPTERN